MSESQGCINRSRRGIGRIGRWLAFGAGVSVMAAACFPRRDREPEPSFECDADPQCAHLNIADACYGAAYCDANRTCQIDFLQDDDACQCASPYDCSTLGFEQLGCNLVACSTDHQCSEEIVDAGPSPEERDGDCADLTCDGESKEPIETPNLEDIRDDNNTCTADSCTEAGPENDGLADGTVCGGGVCFDATCHDGCAPENPDSCGDEGPSEPSNNDGFAATSVSENEVSCGMLDDTDIDWFEVYIEDEDLETDIIGFEVLSSAPTIEICAFVLCENGGFPGGGCSNKQAGPVGSDGCCWTGDPKTLSPTWDLDCSDTTDDTGTMFFSVRAPNGSACESYRISAHY